MRYLSILITAGLSLLVGSVACTGPPANDDERISEEIEQMGGLVIVGKYGNDKRIAVLKVLDMLYKRPTAGFFQNPAVHYDNIAYR